MRPWDASHLPGNAGAPDWFPRVLTTLAWNGRRGPALCPPAKPRAPQCRDPTRRPINRTRPASRPKSPRTALRKIRRVLPAKSLFRNRRRNRCTTRRPAHSCRDGPATPAAGRRPCEVGAFSGRGEALAARRRSGVRQHLVTCARPLDRRGCRSGSAARSCRAVPGTRVSARALSAASAAVALGGLFPLRQALGDELFDLQHRRPGNPLDQRIEIVHPQFAAGLRLRLAQVRNVPANELADLAFDFGRRPLPILVSSSDHGHDASPLRREQNRLGRRRELRRANRAAWRRFLVRAGAKCGSFGTRELCRFFSMRAGFTRERPAFASSTIAHESAVVSRYHCGTKTFRPSLWSTRPGRPMPSCACKSSRTARSAGTLAIKRSPAASSRPNTIAYPGPALPCMI